MGYDREKYLKSIQPKKSFIKSIIVGGITGRVVTWILSNILIDTTDIDSLYSEKNMTYLIRMPFIFIIITIVTSILLYKFFENRNAIRRNYIAIIENQRETSIDRIAQSNNTTYENACKVINEIIKNGALENAYIDEIKREVILPIENIDIHTKILKKSVECPTCGATITVYSHKENKCEYCGSSVEFN